MPKRENLISIGAQMPPFGRQRVIGTHQTLSHYSPNYPTPTRQRAADFHRGRSMTIPNLDGFAGLSFRFTDAKVSLGYRGGFFFNAVDAGGDTRKTKSVGFYGPFANISIGLGG